MGVTASAALRGTSQRLRLTEPYTPDLPRAIALVRLETLFRRVMRDEARAIVKREHPRQNRTLLRRLARTLGRQAK